MRFFLIDIVREVNGVLGILWVILDFMDWRGKDFFYLYFYNF